MKKLLALTSKLGTKVERVIDQVAIVVVKLLHTSLTDSTFTAQGRNITKEDVEQVTSRADGVGGQEAQEGQGALLHAVATEDRGGARQGDAALMMARYLEHLATSSTTGYTGDLGPIWLPSSSSGVRSSR